MTILSTSAFAGPYSPNGATTSFPFSFKALQTSDVRVVRRSATSNVDEVLADYTVTLNGGGGGSVDFTVAPPSGDPLYVLLSPSFLQPVSFTNQGSWSPTAMNGALDSAGSRDIYLKDKADRALMVPRGEAGFELPSEANRAGYLLGFDMDGNARAYEPTSPAGNIGIVSDLFVDDLPVADPPSIAFVRDLPKIGERASTATGAPAYFDGTGWFRQSDDAPINEELLAAYPLDDVPGALAGYGTRKIKQGYSGPAMRVIRTSDGALLDVGFVGTQVDSATLNAFLVGTTGRVATWYDQSGNGRHATQGTSADRPYVASWSMRGSRVLQFNGAQSLTVPVGVAMDKQALTAFFAGGGIGGEGSYAEFGTGAGQFFFIGGGFLNTGVASNIRAKQGLNVVGIRQSATAKTIYENDEAPSVQAAAAAGALTGATIGDLPSVGGFEMIGQMGAAIFYGTALSDANIALLKGAIHEAFNIPAVTTDLILGMGDSIYAGSAAQSELQSPLLGAMDYLPDGTRLLNLSQSGATTGSTIVLYDLTYDDIVTAHPGVIVNTNLGTNNINAGDSGALAFAGLTDVCNRVHANGGRINIATILPSSVYSGPQNTQLAALNTLIRANWATIADGMIDYAANAVMGAVGAPANPLLYNDGLHPTAHGAALLVPETVTAIELLL